jgi:hypothetical protein
MFHGNISHIKKVMSRFLICQETRKLDVLRINLYAER